MASSVSPPPPPSNPSHPPSSSVPRVRSLFPKSDTKDKESKDKALDSSKKDKDPSSPPSIDDGNASISSTGGVPLSFVYQRIGSLNVYKGTHDYMKRVMGCVGGAKALLLDLQSTSILSLTLTQTEILRSNFFLSEVIDVIAIREDLHQQKFDFLSAVAVVSPSKSTLSALSVLLSTPRYSKYFIFFTSVCDAAFIDQLAEADKFHLICEVTEIYVDFLSISPSLFHFDNTKMAAKKRIGHNRAHDVERAMMDRDVSGLVSLCLSLERRPDIRYAASSDHARVLATRVADEMVQEATLFSQFHHEPTLLIIFDRRDDPVTPLLTQWTYLAMIHQLLGIFNNRIEIHKMKKSQTDSKDEKAPPPPSSLSSASDIEQLILNPVQDSFFRTNQFVLFGDMGTKVKSLVKEYQSKTKSDIKMDSLEDLQAVIEKFPEFRQLSGTVTKHMSLMTELAAIVKSRHLMDVSALEQEIVMSGDAANEKEELFSKVASMLQRTDVEWEDKLRLVIIYSLRFETFNGFASEKERLLASLEAQCLDVRHRDRLGTLDKILQFGGFMERRSDLFKSANLLKSIVKIVKSEISGVENIFTQHKPLMVEQMAKLMAGGDSKLADFPFVDGSTASVKTKYRNVIVFVVGGITYEEYTQLETNGVSDPKEREKGDAVSKAAAKFGVQTFNRSEWKILCGGSTIHNANSFMQEVHPIQMDATHGKIKKYTSTAEEDGHDANVTSGGEKGPSNENTTPQSEGTKFAGDNLV